MSLYEQQLAKIKRTKEHQEKTRNMTQRQVVESLVKAQPELNRQGGTVNIREFLQNKPQSSDPNVAPVRFGAQSLSDVLISKPIDVSKITDASWMRPTKQTEARKTLADYQTIPSNIPRGTPKTEEPAARRMGFGQGGGVANLGLQTITTEQPQNYTDFVLGRINTPIEKPQTITVEPEIITEKKEIPFDYTKLALIGGGIVALIAIIMIVRAKK